MTHAPANPDQLDLTALIPTQRREEDPMTPDPVTNAERMRARIGMADPASLPFGHGCGARWSGARTAHCSVCCRTFNGVRPFDLHRRHGACLAPESVGMSLLDGKSYACWGFPTETEETS